MKNSLLVLAVSVLLAFLVSCKSSNSMRLYAGPERPSHELVLITDCSGRHMSLAPESQGISSAPEYRLFMINGIYNYFGAKRIEVLPGSMSVMFSLSGDSPLRAEDFGIVNMIGHRGEVFQPGGEWSLREGSRYYLRETTSGRTEWSRPLTEEEKRALALTLVDESGESLYDGVFWPEGD